MGWIQELNKVYDTMMQLPETERQGLIPVGFTQKSIKYLVALHPDGTFSAAYDLSGKKEKNGPVYMIPTTPQAETRTGSNGTPFPLADQLKYLAYDGVENPRLNQYLSQLNDWCEQPDAPEVLKTLYSYLEKKTLLQDMRSFGLSVQYNKDDAKKDADGKDAKMLVHFSVESAEKITELYARSDVQQSWSRYFDKQSADAKKTLCYATGEQRVPLENHPKIRGNPKLISAKDASYPFQYKGRFEKDGSAATVSLEASLKAHNALNWLLDKQGFRKYGLNIIAWNVQNGPIAVPIEEQGWEEDESDQPDTFEQYALALRDAAMGKNSKLRNFQKQIASCLDAQQRVAETVILGMEAATDGRMSIDYYQELEGNTYVERLETWYRTCCWETYYKQWKMFTPTPLMIAKAVMGEDSVTRAWQDKQCKKADAKQMRELYKRLLFCMVDGQALPRNIVMSAVHRAEFPLSFQEKDSWSRYKWEKCVETTCALIRKFQIDRHSTEAIPDNRLHAACQDRSYLYGRLFAVADEIEKQAQRKQEKTSSFLPTHAIRLMRLFVQRPAETWKKLHMQLIPYLSMLGEDQLAGYYQNIIAQIEQTFVPEQRMKNQPVTEWFLIGLYAQRRELFTEKEQRVPQPQPREFYTPEQNRSEWFGCLLAVADCIERKAESQTTEKQTICERDGNTKALRTMQHFVMRPADTWVQIYCDILPYLQKVGVKAEKYYGHLLHQLEASMDPQQRLDNTPLDSMVLHGYYGMRQCILTKDCKLQVPRREKNTAITCREEAYGKLLALENRMERWVLDAEKSEDENRSSNAVRFMRGFSQRPASNWAYLEQRLLPYEKKIRQKSIRLANDFRTQIDELKRQLEENQWNIDAPLKARWLHDYYVYYEDRKGEE